MSHLGTTHPGPSCRLARERAGLSLREMEALLHRDQSAISRFERGLVCPRDVETIVGIYEKLAPARDVPEQNPLAHTSKTHALQLVALVALVVAVAFENGGSPSPVGVYTVGMTLVAVVALATLARDLPTWGKVTCAGCAVLALNTGAWVVVEGVSVRNQEWAVLPALAGVNLVLYGLSTGLAAGR